MTNLDSILKSISITLPTKIHIVKAVVFPVVVLSFLQYFSAFFIIIFFKLIVFEVSFFQASRLNSFFLLVSAEELMLSNCGAGKDS